MDLLFWILQVLVALVFFMAGTVKLTQPVDRLGEKFDWVNQVPGGLVRLIGLVEVLGAIGLILPALTGIDTWLTPLAAIGLALVMLLALGFNARRTQFPPAFVNLVLCALAAAVAIGRYLVAPF